MIFVERCHDVVAGQVRHALVGRAGVSGRNGVNFSTFTLKLREGAQLASGDWARQAQCSFPGVSAGHSWPLPTGLFTQAMIGVMIFQLRLSGC